MKKDKRPSDKNGLRHGYWEEYYTNGNLWDKGLYIHGKQHGYWEQYDDDGHLKHKCLYNNGTKIGLSNHYLYGNLSYSFLYPKYRDEIFELYISSKNKLIL